MLISIAVLYNTRGERVNSELHACPLSMHETGQSSELHLHQRKQATVTMHIQTHDQEMPSIASTVLPIDSITFLRTLYSNTLFTIVLQ